MYLRLTALLTTRWILNFFEEMAKEWKRLFADKKINKILTIEASGIGIAAIVAREFNVPVVFAKKSKALTLMIITSALKSSHLHIVKYTM